MKLIFKCLGVIGVVLLLLFGTTKVIQVIDTHITMSYNYLGENIVWVMGERGMGTGFHVKAPSGKIYILTNRHVCETTLGNTVMIKDEFMDRPIPKRIIEKSYSHDLCLIEPLEHRKGFNVAKTNVEIWDNVNIVGHPVGGKLDHQTPQFVDSPVITMPKFNISPEECKKFGGSMVEMLPEAKAFYEFFYGITSICEIKYKTDMFNDNVYGGNSGSPVLNNKGEVISVIFAGVDPSYNRASYSVPLEFVKAFLTNY